MLLLLSIDLIGQSEPSRSRPDTSSLVLIQINNSIYVASIKFGTICNFQTPIKFQQRLPEKYLFKLELKRHHWRSGVIKNSV